MTFCVETPSGFVKIIASGWYEAQEICRQHGWRLIGEVSE
jgi:hypothetical protein